MSWQNIVKHSVIWGVPAALLLKAMSMKLEAIDKRPEKFDFKPLPASDEKVFRRRLFEVIDDMGPAFKNLRIQSVKLEEFEHLELYSCNHSESIAVPKGNNRTLRIGLPLDVIQICCSPRINSANASESLYLKNTDSLMLSEKARKFVTVKQLIEAVDDTVVYGDSATDVKFILISFIISIVAFYFLHPLLVVTSVYLYLAHYISIGIGNRKKLDLKWIRTHMGEDYTEGAREYFTKVMLRNYKTYQIQAEERKTSWKKSVLFYLANTIPLYTRTNKDTPIYTCGGNPVKSERGVKPSMGLFIFGKRAMEHNK